MTDTLEAPTVAWSSPEIGELVTALAQAQAEFAPVEKSAENPFFKSHYADLAAIVKATSPITAKHGLAVAQLIGASGDGRTTLRTILAHKSGQWISSEMVLFLAKPEPQAQGSATTYARRYAYSAILGIVTEEDDDGNAAQPSQSTRRTPPARPATTSSRPAAPAPELPHGDEGDPAPGMASVKQMNMIRAMFAKSLSITDGDDLHETVGAYIGRDIDSLRELTNGEVSTVVEKIKGAA